MSSPHLRSQFLRGLLMTPLLLLIISPVQAQLIQVEGNGRVISNGDTTPTARDHTDFGQILAGSGPVDREFTIRNLSRVPLQILFFQRIGTNPANFTIIDPPEPTIPGNSDASMTIRFLPPPAGGLRTATIRIVSTSSIDNDFQFDVAGELVLPSPNIVILGNEIEIPDGFSAPTVENNTDFGTLGIDDPPITRSFTIRNTGEEILRISSIDVTGVNNDQFSITRSPNTFIPPGAESRMDVSFNPTREGSHRVSILVNSNDPTPTERTYSFTLRGEGQSLRPRLILSGNGMEISPGDETPSPEDHTLFPDTDLQSTSTRSFTLSNPGDAPLTIGNVEFVGAHADEFSVSRAPRSRIEPAGEYLLQVNFRPLSRGARSATLRITSNDPSRNVYEVALEGTGGQFKLLGIERDGSDALINFSTSSSLGSYIYRILHSTDMQNWEPVGSIFSSGRETLQFRHRNSTGEAKAFWHVEEVRF